MSVTTSQAIAALLVFEGALEGKKRTGPEQIIAMCRALEAHEAAKPVDYASLLKQYVIHGGRCETPFTPAEWAELKRLNGVREP